MASASPPSAAPAPAAPPVTPSSPATPKPIVLPAPFNSAPSDWLAKRNGNMVTLSDFEALFGDHAGQVLVAMLKSKKAVEDLKILIPDADEKPTSGPTRIEWIQGVGDEVRKRFSQDKPDELISRSLAAPYNELVYLVRKGKNVVEQVNTIHFSMLFALCDQIEYDERVGCFYIYNLSSGAWHPVSEEKVHQKLIRFISPYAQQNVDLYNPKMSTFKEILYHLKAVALHYEVKLEEKQFLCVKNGVVLIDYDVRTKSAFRRYSHSPAYKLRNPIPIEHDSAKTHPTKFIQMLKEALGGGEIITPKNEKPDDLNDKNSTDQGKDKEKKEEEEKKREEGEEEGEDGKIKTEGERRIQDDIDLLQIWCGMVLLGINPFHKIMILSGQAGSGKSTFISVVEKIIGSDNVATLVTGRLEDRFELSEFFGKTLLVGKDVGSDFLSKKSAHMLKSLSGDSGIKAEVKNVQARVRLGGPFNIGIVTNADLKINLQGDADAWARRLWVVNFSRPAADPKANYADVLIRGEGSAILNWMLRGAREFLVKIRTHTSLPFTDVQKQRVLDLLFRSDELDAFVKTAIKSATGDLATEDIYVAYQNYCSMNNAECLDYNTFSRRIGAALHRNYKALHFNVQVGDKKQRKGYRKIAFREKYKKEIPQAVKGKEDRNTKQNRAHKSPAS